MNQKNLFVDEPQPIQLSAPIVLRDYQVEAHQNTFHYFEQGREGVLLRLPTGSGKTLLACAIADTWRQRGPDQRVLVLTHENQLMHQFRDEMQDYFGRYVPIEQGPNAVFGDADIIVASRASLLERTQVQDEELQRVSRLWKFSPEKNWLVIYDEAHRYANHLKSVRHINSWFAINPASRRLGLTATPERGDRVSLKEMFPAVGFDYKLTSVDNEPNAVNDGWAVPYKQYFVTVEGVDFHNLKEIGNEYDAGYLQEVLSERSDLMRLIGPTLEIAGGARTLIFSPTVAMAQKVAKTINGELSSDIAHCLHGAIPHEQREHVYKRFKAGEFQFLSVCGLCREGYNDRDLQAVAVFRPTKSRALAEQMKGRGCRPGSGVVDQLPTREQRREAIAASHKPHCKIIDLVGITGLADCATTASILANGQPDKVIERANRLALMATDGADMVALIEEAREQIDREEREEKRRAAIKRDELRQEEYNRRAKLGVRVRYNASEVTQGHGLNGDPGRPGPRCLWGKFKGELVEDVPTWYLKCCVKHGIFQKIGWLHGAVRKELQLRGN